MPNAATATPAPWSPAATSPCTWLPALVPSRQEKGQAPGRNVCKETSMQRIVRRPRHILTFDIEEHFHASRFDSAMRRRNWPSFHSRAQASVERILELLALHSTKATFFSLGWLAERHPAIIRAVSAAGHEIACLGYGHELVAAQTPQLFRADIRRAKRILEDITGSEIVGYRAPSLSITAHTPWALQIVAEEGFLYDSSVLPIRHGLAGIPGASPWIHGLALEGIHLWEIPPSTMNLGGFRKAIGGGGYLRAFRYPILKSLLSRIEAIDEPIVVYLRSWEIDAAQPRMRDTVLSEFRHYFNLDKTAGRLDQLLTDFPFGPVCEVVIAIHDQVQNASERTALHSDPRDFHQESPRLTTV